MNLFATVSRHLLMVPVILTLSTRPAFAEEFQEIIATPELLTQLKQG